MVIDSSALMAIILAEPDAEVFARVLSQGGGPYSMSAATFVEVNVAALNRDGQEARAALELLIAQNGIRIVPVDEELARLAVDAWTRFGPGRGAPLGTPRPHPAQRRTAYSA